jgi:hypothetical protein
MATLAPQAENRYEQERLQRIAENRRRLETLGVMEAVDALNARSGWRLTRRHGLCAARLLQQQEQKGCIAHIPAALSAWAAACILLQAMGCQSDIAGACALCSAALSAWAAACILLQATTQL